METEDDHFCSMIAGKLKKKQNIVKKAVFKIGDSPVSIAGSVWKQSFA